MMRIITPMPRTRFLPLLSAGWLMAVGIAFHFGPDPFPPGGLASLALDLVLLASIAAAAWGLGSLLLSPLRLRDDSAIEAPFFEIGAGLGGLALALFALSAAQILYRPVVVVALAFCVLLLGRGRRREGMAAVYPRPWSRSDLALMSLPLLAGVVTLAASLAPPEFYDALLYHLAVPDRYVQHHGMLPIPGNYYAHYPANMGMLYAIGLLLRGGSLAQSLHWLCGAMAACALYASASRHLDRTTAILACAIFCLTPGIMLTATWAIADLCVTLFATLCFAAILNLWRGGERRWLIAAGIFAGLALGTKYTAAVLVCAPAAAAIALRPAGSGSGPGHRRRAALEAALFAGIALALVAPWLARNAIIAGNPLAPYFSAGAGGEGSPPDVAGEMARRLPREGGAPALAAHYLLAPWRATMTRMGQGGYLGPVLLMLIPTLLLMRGLPAATAPVALMTAIGCVAWAVSSQVVRYLFPLLPLAAILAAIAARRLPRLVAVPALAWSLAYNMLLFMLLIETIGSLRAVTGAEPAGDYLGRRVTYYPAMAWLEINAPPKARILFVGEGRTFYCPRECVASSPFDAPLLDRYAAESGSERALLARLRAEGFTHLLVSEPELRRARQTTADEVMRRFFPSGAPHLEFEGNGVRIYYLPA